MTEGDRGRRTLGRVGGLLFSLANLSLAGCGGGAGPTGSSPPGAGCSRNALAAEMQATLASIATDSAFSFFVETASGRRFAYDRSGSTMTTVYESASTSKWVSAVVILRAVDKGYLALSSRPQDQIPGWDIPAADPLAGITLAHLLSFTSGLVDEPLCLDLPRADFESCVATVARSNRGNGKRPGAEFFYSSGHLQVAGLMAVRASGARDWQELFGRFRAETGLFPTGSYDLPSSGNPRLAGGMHWTGAEYVDFLRALERGTLLSNALRSEMDRDQLTAATIGHSPARLGVGQDWHYGFGHWLECPSLIYNCAAATYHSSPGAYGAYPFLNTASRFLGIVARQGAGGTFAEGKAVFDSVRAKAEAWAACSTD